MTISFAPTCTVLILDVSCGVLQSANCPDENSVCKVLMKYLQQLYTTADRFLWNEIWRIFFNIQNYIDIMSKILITKLPIIHLTFELQLTSIDAKLLHYPIDSPLASFSLSYFVILGKINIRYLFLYSLTYRIWIYLNHILLMIGNEFSKYKNICMWSTYFRFASSLSLIRMCVCIFF